MAPGPLPAVRRGRELLGAGRDGEGRGRDPRDGSGWGGNRETRSGGDGTDHRHRRTRLGLAASPAARRAGSGAGIGGRRLGRGARRVATLPRSARGATADGPDLRGPPLGRRRAPRFPRLPDRLDARRSAARALHGETRAPGPEAGLGRGQAECGHHLPRASVRRRDGAPPVGSPRPDPAPGRAPSNPARARRRQSALCGGVRADGRGPLGRRPVHRAAARLGAGDHRGTPRRAGP